MTKCDLVIILCLAGPFGVSAQSPTPPPAPPAPAEARFQVALTALHDFEYEEANDGFLQAQKIDPTFALAYWGEAMTYYQVLWRNENVDSGRRALARLAPTAAGRAAKARSGRDKGLLAAAEVLFGEGDPVARHTRYADAMGSLSAAYPDDPDIASLYALALMGTVSRSLIGYSDAQDLRQPGLAGSDVQRRVAAILNRVLARHPEHHGALHYLLHDYDDPEHAPLALGAARTYARVAGRASHALHMPSHVFLQLGLWKEAASSDRASYQASDDWVRRKRLALTLRNYHALSWLQYELLQLGRYAEAHDAIGQLEPVVRASGAAASGAHGGQHQPLLSDLSSMRARYVVESRRWDTVAGQTTFGNVNELFAIGMGAARTGNIRTAQTVRAALATRARAPEEGDMRPAIAIMEREITALIELAEGRKGEAINILQAAARAEGELPPPLGLPAPLKPAPELLGEVLLDVGRPREAIAPFEQVLKRHSNRSLSVLGMARAATAIGDASAARQRYQELLTNFEGADADLSEVREARTAIARPAARAEPYAPAWLLGGGAAAAGLAVVLALSWRRRRRRPVTAKPRKRKT